MRTRELIRFLESQTSKLRVSGLFVEIKTQRQANETRRLMALHEIENVLPEIIDKLKRPSHV